MSIRNIYDTAANLTLDDLVLGAGELGFESDTGLVKLGDGSTAWTSLSYYYIGVGNRVWVPAATMLSRDGATLTIGVINGGTWPYYQFPDAVQRTAEGTYTIPKGWSAYDLYAWIAPINSTSSAAADLQFLVYQLQDATTGQTNIGGGSVSPTISATAGTLDRVLVGTGLNPPSDDKICMCRCRRFSTGSYADDIAFLGLELVPTA